MNKTQLKTENILLFPDLKTKKNRSVSNTERTPFANYSFRELIKKAKSLTRKLGRETNPLTDEDYLEGQFLLREINHRLH